LSNRLDLAENEVVRLPTEWEWQWVAQAGAQAREYPWHGEWNVMRANSYESGIGRTTAVGMYPLGAPDCWPVMDLAGNVWEWCVNEHDTPGNTAPGADVSRVLRGGAWYDYPRALSRGEPQRRRSGLTAGGYIGFRVCRGAPIEPPGVAPLDTVPLPR
jgi:formylglycine-generating enzyme required for sulfatase activity